MGAPKRRCSFAMRIAFVCVTVLAVALFLGQQAESRDLSPAERGFLEEEVDSIVEPFEEDAEAELFQEDTQETAKGFTECDFGGKARSEDTPLVIRGHNDVASLKVPSGQCAALFTKAGYNGAARGEMLEIRGPKNV